MIFSLLFDTSFWYDILLVILLIGLVVFCVKVREGRIFVFSLLGIALLCVSGYCGIQLNKYYSAEGGIYGYITGLVFPENSIDVQDKFVLNLSNLTLQQESGEIYSTVIYTEKVFAFDKDENYGFFVNGNICSSAEIKENYVLSTYSYTFLDNEIQELLTDTLYFNFGFYEKGSELKIYTKGGQTAVDYWTKYFSRNNMIVSIEKNSYSFAEDEINLGTGDISEYRIVNYLKDNEVFLKQAYKVGSKINPPKDFPGLEAGTYVETWLTDDGEIFDFSKTFVTENLNLHVGEIVNSINQVNFIFSSDGTIENQVSAGKFFSVDYNNANVSGSSTDEMNIIADRNSALIVDVRINCMFEFNNFSNSIFCYGDNGNILNQLECLEEGSISPTETGFVYGFQLYIPSLNSDCTIVVKAQPKVFNFRISYTPASAGLDYKEIIINDAYTYGKEIDLKSLLNSAQIDSLTSNNSAGAKFNGISTKALDGQGTKYFDRNLNCLSGLYLFMLEFNGSTYDYASNYDPSTETFSLYAVYNINI